MKLSVIVPVYNVEKYLAECVDSLLNQTLRDMEILLVDDGSEEETAEKLTAAITPRKKSRSSTPEYKKAMTYLMTKENIEAAWKASGGELA